MPEQAFTPPPGFPEGRGMAVPQRGAFALSEAWPMIQQASAAMEEARQEWVRLRIEADEKKAHASKLRADFMIRIRVFGNPETGQVPIKTDVERRMWANADPDIQQAELEADLAQTVQMAAREAYDDRQAQFDALRSALSMERDLMSREWNGPHPSP